MVEARIDLHTHTSHSEDRERIVLPHGASVTMPFHPTLSPLAAYNLALERGLTHVTFTDHDTLNGCLELLEQHPSPDRFITGEEVTCYHQGVPLHLGVYGLTEDDHRQLHAGSQRTDRERVCLRWNLPELLAWLNERKLAYDLKHPLWARGGLQLTRDQLRALLGMFPLIEGINGTRHRWLNELGTHLAARFGRTGVAFTGGSDSHTDNIGRCYTQTFGETPAEVLEHLRAGRCEPVGPHGSHRLLDADIRAVAAANLERGASQLLALADDQLQDFPGVFKELLHLLVTGAVAYSVVQEFARQRALAREVEALFAADLEQGSLNGQALAAPATGGAVHRYVRRD